MIVTIHQPEHLPWLGLFNKVAKADIFVVLDSVQFEKNYFQNRNRILGSNGVNWLTVPVQQTGHMQSTIKDTKIQTISQKWKEKYLQTVRQSYGKYDYFYEVFPILEESLNLDTEYLIDINMSIIKKFADKLRIYPEYVMASSLSVTGLKSDLILNICKAVNATEYIAGPSGRDYLNTELFFENNIIVKYNDYNHPIYPQKRTNEFISHLSALDLFMNVGFQQAKNIIMFGNEGLND